MSFRLTGELILVSIRGTVAHTLNAMTKGAVKQSYRENEVVISGIRRTKKKRRHKNIQMLGIDGCGLRSRLFLSSQIQGDDDREGIVGE